MNVALWGRALVTIQRVDKAGWERLDLVSRWLIASRASVLVITVISVAIAGLLALRAGRFDPLLWVLTAVALVLAHATNNLLNDLTDHVKGVDRNNYFRAVYGPHALEHHLLTVRGLIAYAAASGLVALTIGAYLVSVRGPLALALMAAGVFFVLFYTYPLKYVGLGELAVIGFLTPVVLIVVLALPRARTALAAYAKPRPRERPEHWPQLAWPLYFVRLAFVHNRRFGLLLLVGLAGDLIVRVIQNR